MGIEQSQTPTSLIVEWAFQRQALCVVPEALADDIVDDDVSETGRERRAARSRRRNVSDAALSSDRVVTRRTNPRPECLVVADVPLIRVRRFGVVVQQV